MVQKIITEIQEYKNGSVELFEGYLFSAYKLIRRIALYMNQIYTTGKFDSQGNYKYWFEIIKPRSAAEIKNIDFDTKDIELSSDRTSDSTKVLIANAALKNFLKETGQGEKLNTSVEQGTDWGNVVWKKIKGGYKIINLTNFMVLNQTAETLEQSDVIEEEVMVASDLRKMSGVWNSERIEDLIKGAKPKKGKSSTEFFIYERNGEVSDDEYEGAKAEELKLPKKAGLENQFYLAKIIVAGLEKDKPTHVLFCETINEKPYKEYHRTAYTGTWLRVGMYQLLMDIQTRANEIGNQIARGLDWAAKTVFRSSDKVLAQNILTDLQNGDVIKSQDLAQVETRMNGLDQLIADWNRLMQLADLLANSFEIVTGAASPSGTPFKLGALQDQNAGKLFDFIREKLGLAFQGVIQDWVLPDLILNLKRKDVLRLTADEGYLVRYYQAIVDDWYLRNLVSLPPHDANAAQTIKDEKLQELMKNNSMVVKLEKEIWKDFYPVVRVDITGENRNLRSELESLQTFIALEGDPVRRTALIEEAMRLKNIDITKFPKTPPQPAMPAPEKGATPNGSSVMDNLIENQNKQLAR